jgi:hypothetical protein
LASKALQSIENLATNLDYAAKLVLTVFHLFSYIADSSVIFSGADHFGDIWAARRSWQFHYGDHQLNQGATVPNLGMPISFWTSVCVLKTIYSLWLDLDVTLLWFKTMYVVVVLYGYLSRWCSKKYICC